MLQIRKNVPMPEPTARVGVNMQLLQSMDEGDSVFFDSPIAKKASRFYRVATKLGYTIALRKEKDGIAMWVVKKPKGAKTIATNGSGAHIEPAPVKKAAKKAPAKKPAAKKKAKK